MLNTNDIDPTSMQRNTLNYANAKKAHYLDSVCQSGQASIPEFTNNLHKPNRTVQGNIKT